MRTHPTTLPRLVFGLLLLLALGVGSTPAYADQPPEAQCPPDYDLVGSACVPVTPPSTVVENPPGAPVPQFDTGNSGTGTWAEGEEVTGYPCYGLRQQEWSPVAYGGGVYTVQARTCTEQRGDGYARAKTRFTFYYDHPTGGRSTAYGNVRWDVAWNTAPGSPNVASPLRRNVIYCITPETCPTIGLTANRADAIQVHSTVAYSNWGCNHQIVGRNHYALARNHFVRMPQGSLFGPISKDSGKAAWSCP